MYVLEEHLKSTFFLYVYIIIIIIIIERHGNRSRVLYIYIYWKYAHIRDEEAYQAFEREMKWSIEIPVAKYWKAPLPVHFFLFFFLGRYASSFIKSFDIHTYTHQKVLEASFAF